MFAAATRLLLPAYLAACLLLGGASAAGVVANGVVQVAGVAAACVALAAGTMPRLERRAFAPLLLVLGTAVLLMLELVPLPPAVWTMLPGRAAVAGDFALARLALPWLPVSLHPDGTLVALGALIPAAAVLLLGYATPYRVRITAAVVLVVVAAVSVLLGVTQRLGGAESPLYLYAFTNRGGPTGFFANSNHLATLELVAIPFSAALMTGAHHRAGTERRHGRRIAFGAVAVLLALGVIAGRSAAGQLLLLPVAAASFLLFQRAERIRWRRWQVRAGLAGMLVAVPLGIAAVATVNHLGAEADALDPHMRRTAIATTLRAALDHLPLGSGGGSMPLVYPLYEDPAAARAQFLNHAHSDVAEVLLEHGLPGLALMIAGVALWVGCGRRLWRRDAAGDVRGDAVRLSLARAGFVAVGAVLAHSVVDYPLRTAAIMAATGFAALMMIAPPPVELAAPRRRRARRAQGGRRRIAVDLGGGAA